MTYASKPISQDTKFPKLISNKQYKQELAVVGLPILTYYKILGIEHTEKLLN